MTGVEGIMQIRVEKTVKKQRKPKENESGVQLLRDAAEEKCLRSSDPSKEMKERVPIELLHELRVHQIELEMQNEELRKAQIALEESRQRYADLYDFAPVGYFTFTPEALVKEVNLTGAALLDTVRQKLISTRFRRIVAAKDQDLWDHHFLKVLQQGEKQTCDLTLRRQDGSTFYAGLESIRVEVNRGAVEVHTSVSDITERRLAEKALRKNGEKLNNLFDNGMEGIFQMTPEGRLITANRAFAGIFGYESPEEFINTGTDIAFQMYAEPDEMKKFIDILKEIGYIKNYECQIRKKNGDIFWGSVNARFTETVDGVPCFEGFIIDVSGRKRAEEDLKKSQEKYRNIFENALEGIYQATPEGRFLAVNPALARMYGYNSPEELINSVTDLAGQAYTNPEQRRDFIQLLEEKGAIKGFEVQLKRKDGTPIWVSNSALAVRDSTGKTLYYEGISEEITQRLESDRKIKETLENLRKAVGGIIQVVSSTVEARDPYTAGHQRRVADLARAIAGDMGLSDDQQEGLRMAGTIHDLGKISIPAEILSKPTKLTGIEYQLIQAHSQIGYDILKGIEFPWPIADMVLQHHERMNGSGYPQGLKEEEISLEARILMVADVVEAMASYRPYRPALGIEVALEEIEKNKGILYNPKVVEVCQELFKEKGFKFE